MSKKVMVFVGTSKGGFIFNSDAKRKKWQQSDIQFKSWNVMHMQLDPRDNRLHAAVNHFVYGPTTHYSDDFGKTWTQARQVPAIGRASKTGRPIGTPQEAAASAEGASPESQLEKLIKIWNIKPGRENEANVLYAGGEPACLFISKDRGETWSLNEGLFDHPHRGTFYPGNGGLCHHTILLDPVNEQRMYIAISSGGCYRTDDGGQTWKPFNKNVRADFHPEKFPEYGQCVHKMTLHPANPNVLYQQNHCGIYRSDNRGDDWVDISEGLPSRFGFPMVIHPHDPHTVYTVPLVADVQRVVPEGQMAVWRTRNDGNSWEQLTTGLPGDAWLTMLRDAMATDPCESCGVYVGTTGGHLFYSRDEGDTWQSLTDYLPPVQSVAVARVVAA